MKPKDATADVGVIIARMQVHELHDSHRNLIKFVQEQTDRVIVVLGVSPTRNTLQNPLDFKSRKQMLTEEYPHLDIFYVNDCRDDAIWSKNLDRVISQNTNPDQKVILFGSRDSFVSHYKGKYKTCELESDSFLSGTEVRKKIANFYVPTKDYRAGVIAGTASRFPTCYQAVDCAVLSQDGDRVLLARKPEEFKWRFIGGFSDTKSTSLEEDVRREVQEEANCEISSPKYVTSMLVDDWRFRKEKDKIKTALFKATYVFGSIQGGDDVAVVQWFPLVEETKLQMVEEHQELFSILLENIKKGKD